MSGRPRIGVSVSARTGWRVFPFFRQALWCAGAQAVKLSSRRPHTELGNLDGIIIGGGDDVGVHLYGGELLAHSSQDPERDALELTLIDAAEKRRLPMLGVCRGAQLINVVRGGTLHGDIYRSFPEARRMSTPLPRKTVSIEPGSHLARIIGTEPSRVNALHRQSVDRLGDGLVPVAWDEAGIIQAVEGIETDRFVIGVQWHPEYLVFSKRDRRLFGALATAC